MALFHGPVIFNAMTCAVHVSLLIPMMARTMDPSLTAKQQNQKAVETMIFFGLGEIFGSILNGYLNDKLGPKRFTIVYIFQMCVSYTLLIWFNWSNSWN